MKPAAISLFLVLVLAVSILAPPAQGDETDTISSAQQHFTAGEYSQAALLVGPLTRDPTVRGAIRAEAHRLYGLSLFLLGLPDEAEEALLAYLRLSPDAHLDPALVPPEAIVFFEDVRARHAGELLAAKPRPRQKHYFVLNFLPPFGQFQNGDRTTGWIIGVSELLFLATNVTTFFLLRDMCNPDDGTCSDIDTAEMMHKTNIASGVAFWLVYAYGVLDGIRNYRSRAPLMVTPSADGGGGMVWMSWGF